ncbi:hypothetical protein RHGRI_025580 [Rhododendron griersonianum]|uniref:Uncharacterized protein n=1 Tax=Rhododendron griersonianum TaxID=479676 RepID=A0AAV6IU74_9ERIC|nr:hypothetical protein RHGRI_025580 [Rhododendron griersonianum]
MKLEDESKYGGGGGAFVIFSKNIVFLAPGVTPSPVAEEKFRPSRLFMELAYARCQRMKKEHGLEEIFMGRMGGIALDPSRTCTNRLPFDVSLPEYVLPEAMFSFATKGER